jgi:hypothetical protein
VTAIEWLLRKVKPFVMPLVSKGKELWDAGKRKVTQVGTGSMSPQEKLDRGMDLAVRAVNRFRGRKVGEAILNPLLSGIASRYSFVFLRVVPHRGKWMVHGRVNPDDKKEAEAEVGTENPEELKPKVAEAVAAEVGDGVTIDQVPVIVPKIRKRIIVFGAEDLVTLPKPGGLIRVSFRANRQEIPAGVLVPILGAVPEGRTVRSETLIRLVSKHPINNLGAILPANIPAGGVQPNVEFGGRVGTSGNQIQILTWNTSPMEQTGGSHAEAQMTSVFESDPRKAILAHVESIIIRNFTYSSCSSCSDGLAGMLREICSAQKTAGKVVLREAIIYWTSLFDNAEKFIRPDKTTWKSIMTMASAGWTIHAPATALPDPKARPGNEIAEQASFRPLHQPVVVIAGTIQCNAPRMSQAIRSKGKRIEMADFVTLDLPAPRSQGGQIAMSRAEHGLSQRKQDVAPARSGFHPEWGHRGFDSNFATSSSLDGKPFRCRLLRGSYSRRSWRGKDVQ